MNISRIKAILDIVGWPNGMQHDIWPHDEATKSYHASTNNFFHDGTDMIRLQSDPEAYEAIITQHMWGLVRERFETRLNTIPQKDATLYVLQIHYTDKTTGLFKVATWSDNNVLDLLCDTLTWIKEQDDEDNG